MRGDPDEGVANLTAVAAEVCQAHVISHDDHKIRSGFLRQGLLTVMMRQALGWQAGPFALSTADAIRSSIPLCVNLRPLWFQPSRGQETQYHSRHHR